jgi:organic hydroperoxide reductase OsmC/OhrA
MTEHRAALHWKRTSSDFAYDTYNREHTIAFKNGSIVVPGSAAPEFKGDGTGADPEEQFVAALSACHMLTFLAVAARKRLAVDTYDDDARGHLEKGKDGKFRVTSVTLRPRVRFGADTNVDSPTLDELHRLAHNGCFIANSVTTTVTVEPQS